MKIPFRAVQGRREGDDAIEQPGRELLFSTEMESWISICPRFGQQTHCSSGCSTVKPSI